MPLAPGLVALPAASADDRGWGCSPRTRRRSTGRGSSAALISVAFLALARLGLFGRLISHQRLVNTFVTNVPGPAEPFFFAGRRISDVIAVSPIAGNVTVAFAALSYAGTLAVTVIADPDTCPDLDRLAAALQRGLDELTRRNSGNQSASSSSTSRRGADRPGSP